MCKTGYKIINLIQYELLNLYQMCMKRSGWKQGNLRGRERKKVSNLSAQRWKIWAPTGFRVKVINDLRESCFDGRVGKEMNHSKCFSNDCYSQLVQSLFLLGKVLRKLWTTCILRFSYMPKSYSVCLSSGNSFS